MKTKRIISIVIISIVALLAGLIIASAFIPKNFGFGFKEPESVTIWRKNDVQSSYELEYNNPKFKEFMNKFNEGFKSSALNTFFQGKLFHSVETIDQRKSLTNSDLTNSDKIYIEFHYSEPQTTQLHGSKITLDEQEKTYKHVVIEISNTNNLSQVSAYLRYGTNSVNDYSYIRYVSYGANANLYKFIENEFTI